MGSTRYATRNACEVWAASATQWVTPAKLQAVPAADEPGAATYGPAPQGNGAPVAPDGEDGWAAALWTAAVFGITADPALDVIGHLAGVRLLAHQLIRGIADLLFQPAPHDDFLAAEPDLAAMNLGFVTGSLQSFELSGGIRIAGGQNHLRGLI